MPGEVQVAAQSLVLSLSCGAIFCQISAPQVVKPGTPRGTWVLEQSRASCCLLGCVGWFFSLVGFKKNRLFFFKFIFLHGFFQTPVESNGLLDFCLKKLLGFVCLFSPHKAYVFLFFFMEMKFFV